MAKRKLESHAAESSGKHVAKSDGQFVIPTLLKTEQIEVEGNIKPYTESKTAKITISTDNILTFTCGGCGLSGIHNLGSEYRLVKTAMLVEVSTQTGDESTVTESPIEESGPNIPSLDQSSAEVVSFRLLSILYPRQWL